jgi:hypothetical protein
MRPPLFLYFTNDDAVENVGEVLCVRNNDNAVVTGNNAVRSTFVDKLA